MGKLKNEFTWSHSSHGTFSQCLRKYYEGKYRMWDGWLPDSPEESRLAYSLKCLQGIHAWKGDLLHRTIQYHIQSVRNGAEVSVEELLQWVNQVATREWSSSLKLCREQFPQAKKNVVLVEHYYPETREKFSSQTTLGLILHNISEWILNYYTSQMAGTIRKAPKNIPGSGIISIEELDHILVDGVKVWVKMDLVLVTAKNPCLIVDWKSGKRSMADTRQLSIYSMYANQKWGIPLSMIRAVDIYLREGKDKYEIYPHVDEADIADTVSFIRSSIDSMRELLIDVENNVPGDISMFPMCSQEPKRFPCSYCNFRGMCFK